MNPRLVCVVLVLVLAAAAAAAGQERMACLAFARFCWMVRAWLLPPRRRMVKRPKMDRSSHHHATHKDK